MSDVAAPEAVAPAAPAAAPSAPIAAPAVPVSDGQKIAAPAPAPTDGEAKPDPKPEQKPESRDNEGRDRRKMSRLYREAAEWKAKAELFERKLQENQPKATDPDVPRLENYRDIEEYANAKAKHAAEQAIKERETRQQSESQKQSMERLESGWREKFDRGEEKYEDFHEKVGNLRPETPWAMAIMEAENGDDIAYFLGTHEAEARRIIGLPALSQIREIGRLEAKLLAEPPVKPKKPSAAPAPIAPLAGTSTPTSDQPAAGDDDKTWFRKRLRAGAKG